MGKAFDDIFGGPLSIEDKISQVRIKAFKEFPFFSYILEHIRIFISKEVPTAGIDGMGKMYINEEFFGKLTLQQQLGTIVHEIMHVALDHAVRGKGRPATVNGARVINIAADISINDMLVKNKITIPECGIIPANDEVTVFGITIQNIPDKSMEDIYNELCGQLQEKYGDSSEDGEGEGEGEGNEEGDGSGSSSQPPSKKGKGSGGKKFKATDFGDEEGKGFDSHDQWDKKGNSEGESDKGDGAGDKTGQKPDFSKNREPKDWGKIISEAYAHAKLRGNEPAGFERMFEDLTTPKLDWRRILHNAVENKIFSELSYRRPNKRYLSHDIYQPTFFGEKITILASIDTSGSMGQRELTEVVSELVGISRTFDEVEFRLLTHDTDVHDDIVICDRQEEQLSELKVHGGGGTSHIPLYDYIEDNCGREDAKLLISFTDGYSEYPDAPPRIETLFVMVGGTCPPESMPDWGDRIVLE